ncbi:MAG TPA: hypothetical protein VGN12_02940 [Pirellulales bacterium]
MTPEMRRSSRLAGELQSAAKLPEEVIRAAASGLQTGAKSVVNSSATAVYNFATLGLDNRQLELLGITEEDRANGYDTAVAIATASGQVLVAIGTSGIATALAKGGTIARSASGTLIAYDSVGNAVGVVQGTYDAAKNGINLKNGIAIAGNTLGLTSNFIARKQLLTAKPSFKSEPRPAPTTTSPKPTADFRVGKHGEMPSPRPGLHSHHGVMSAWMKRKYPNYDESKAPAVLMPKENHKKTYGVYNAWRAHAKREMGGTFDWNSVPEDEVQKLSERMFDASGIPHVIRKQYWCEYDKLKGVLRRTGEQKQMEGRGMADSRGVLIADEMRRWYGTFYDRSSRAILDPSKAPPLLRPLLPYAEFWGLADDRPREHLVAEAARDVRQNLCAVVARYDDYLDDWLAGPEGDASEFSDEYIAYSALRMAADYAAAFHDCS